MYKTKKILSAVLAAVSIMSLNIHASFAESEEYGKVVFDYDREVNGEEYDSKTFMNKNQTTVSADSSKGISVLFPNDNNQIGKAWAGIGIDALGSDAVHLEAVIDASGTARRNLSIGLTDGNHYRMDQHSNNTNGTHLNVLSLWYNAALNSDNSVNQNSDGTAAVFHTGRHEGWTNHSVSGTGYNPGNIDGKNYGMKHLLSNAEAGNDDIKIDITITYMGWSGVLSIGSESTNIDYMPYSYGNGKGYWYNVCKTPKNIVFLSNLTAADNEVVFKKLKVTKVPSSTVRWSDKDGIIYTTLDSAQAENVKITDKNGNNVPFTKEAYTDTAVAIKESAATTDFGSAEVAVGTKFKLSDSSYGNTYTVTVPKDTANAQGLAFDADFTKTFTAVSGITKINSASYTDSKVTAVYNYAEELPANGGKAILAAYDENNVLLGTKVEDLKSGENTIEASVASAPAAVKVFLWNSLSDMVSQTHSSLVYKLQ